ncbi:hypothetical protein QP028_06180 [Corynebacterium suedekumii]|nr:hypothetical protein QP028_06180 [Corynebacterium suedekumii]
MVELQAGVGQLGTGATEVADGVGTAVDQVVGLGALQGQLLGMIDDTVAGLEGATDPDLVDARTRLQDLRGQVEMAQLDGDLANQLTALKDGSREVANQLAVPGYAFHDGIYSATKGAQDLSHGLTEAQGGVDEAVAGVEELDAGVQRIDQMATQTQDRIGAIQRALPVVQAAGTGEGVAAAAASEETIPTLAPMYAMLIAALVMLGGAASESAHARGPGRLVDPGRCDRRSHRPRRGAAGDRRHRRHRGRPRPVRPDPGARRRRLRGPHPCGDRPVRAGGRVRRRRDRRPRADRARRLGVEGRLRP